PKTAETVRCTRVLRVITAMGDLRQRREKQRHAARTAASWLFLNLLDETGLWQQSKGRLFSVTDCCAGILMLLVPKLCLGTHSGETLFRVWVRTRNGVSRPAFPNRVWERGLRQMPATCCTPILPGFFGRDAPISNEKGEPGASSVGRTQQREKSSHDSEKKFRLMQHDPSCR